MKTTKKDRPKAGTFEQSCPGLAAAKRNGPRQTRREYAGPAPRTVSKIIISNSRQNASPNLDEGGGVFPMSWAFTLTVIGAAGLVRQFARLIDWIER